MPWPFKKPKKAASLPAGPNPPSAPAQPKKRIFWVCMDDADPAATATGMPDSAASPLDVPGASQGAAAERPPLFWTSVDQPMRQTQPASGNPSNAASPPAARDLPMPPPPPPAAEPPSSPGPQAVEPPAQPPADEPAAPKKKAKRKKAKPKSEEKSPSPTPIRVRRTLEWPE